MQIQKYFKQIIAVILVLIFLISVGWNLYNWLKSEQTKYYQGGAIQMRDTIYNVVVKEGRVIIGNSEGKRIMLIPFQENE